MEAMSEEDVIELLADALWEERLEEAEQYAEQTTLAMIEEEKAEERSAEECRNSQPAFVDPDRMNMPVLTDGKTEEEKTKERVQETQAEMAAELNEKQEEHLVRGAMLRCRCGSHYRRLNLPTSHGQKESERPLMNAEDYMVGPDKNIPVFGVCNSPNNKSGETILLKKDFERDIYGKKISDTSDGNVKGKPCMPLVREPWFCAHEETQIDGAAAITPSSFLVCEYGGIIEVVDSGQQDEETAVKGSEK